PVRSHGPSTRRQAMLQKSYQGGPHMRPRSGRAPMIDPIRRSMLATGAAATALAATAPSVLAQQGQQGAAMSFYERGAVRIRYEEAGSGFPLLLIAGGGLNSTMAALHHGAPFDPVAEFKNE